jgi:endoglucanase
VIGLGTPAGAITGTRDWRLADLLLELPVKFSVTEDSCAARQADLWAGAGRDRDAAMMRGIAATPQAIWFNAGPPHVDVAYEVRRAVKEAAQQRAVPVLVAYYVPGRDCAQYSAGGAPTEEAYREWIDAFASGIGNRPAVVILEPDSLALLPGEPPRPPEPGPLDPALLDPALVDPALVEQRFRAVRYAVERLRRNLLTAVYLDAGHSSWQPLLDDDGPDAASPGVAIPGSASPGAASPPAVASPQLGMATRLIRAGVDRATGFFLNASNYRSTEELIAYGTQLSKCIYLRQRNGGTACTADQIAAVRVPSRKLTHFVIDTSRNGQGPWEPPDGLYPDPQNWCNPPGRGLGPRPTTRTGDPLVHAFLWIKRPGESDGASTRGTPGPEDPVYGGVDPPAGDWWPEYALGLAERANPPL